MKRIILEKNISFITIFIYIISLIPIFIIAQYNYPSADDYDYGMKAYHAWNESHNIVAVIQAAIQTIKDNYFTWQGTFSGIFLMSLQPGIFGSQWYFLVPYIIISSLTISYLFLLKIILIDYLKTNKYNWLTISFSLLLISIALAYHKAQAFFWYNGCIYYSFIFTLSLILLGCLLKYPLLKNKTIQFLLMIFIIFLSIFIGGGNFATALFTPVLIVVSAFCFRLSGKNIPIPVYISITFILIGLIISSLAPGNTVRQNMSTHTPSAIIDTLKAIGSSCKDLIRWQNPAVILIFIFLSPMLYSIAKNSKLKFRYPLLINALSFGVYCSFYVPVYFAMGWKGPYRMVTVGRYIFYWFLLFNFFYYIGYIIRQKEAGKSTFSRIEKKIYTLSQYLKKHLTYTYFIIIIILCYPLTLPNSTFRIAISELKNGEARQYAKEMRNREILYLSNQKNIIVDELTVKPKMLFHLDISTDKNYWSNMNVTRYFRKESVILKER